jgi:hypothetical protein
VFVLADIGPATAILEAAATAIAAGVVAGGFVVAGLTRLIGASDARWRIEAASEGFWGGAWGMLCLCFDLAVRYVLSS